MKKTILLLCMLTFLCPTPIAANEISSIENTDIEVRADIKEWKYKFINGKLYKRPWNSTQKRWETNWIPA